MGVYAALLRGINVGGKNKLPMADLADVFTGLGCRDVCTYIQSGNVVFEASERFVKRFPRDASAVIDELFGLKVPVVLRSATELTEAVEQNPFLAHATDAKPLHVAFLADLPAKAKVDGLDPERSPGDRFAVRGRDVYLFCPKGMARSKLTTAYFDSRLGTVSTVRNWNTVLKLLDLVNSLGR